jgi:hypothetical protein
VTERQSLDTPRIPSQIPSKPRDVAFSEIARSTIFRRGFQDTHPNSTSKTSLIQARRRRGYSESNQFLPLHIHVPPPVPRFEPAGYFENPRKAPLPHGLKFNTTQPHRVPSHSSTVSTCSSSSTTSDTPSTPLTVIGTHLPPMKLVNCEMFNPLNSGTFLKPRFSNSPDSILIRKCNDSKICGRKGSRSEIIQLQ